MYGCEGFARSMSVFHSLGPICYEVKTLPPHVPAALILPHNGLQIKSSRPQTEISKTMRQNKSSLPQAVSVWYFVMAVRREYRKVVLGAGIFAVTILCR